MRARKFKKSNFIVQLLLHLEPVRKTRIVVILISTVIKTEFILLHKDISMQCYTTIQQVVRYFSIRNLCLPTGWPELLSRSLSYQNYTFCSKKNLAGYLKTPKVTRISAMYVNFLHPPVHSGPICFSEVENLELTSGTNKNK